MTGGLIGTLGVAALYSAWSQNPSLIRGVATAVLFNDLVFIGSVLHAQSMQGYRPKQGSIDETIHGPIGLGIAAIEAVLMAYTAFIHYK